MTAPDPLTHLETRLQHAARVLDDATARTLPGSRECQGLASKAAGVRLALSYLEETRRMADRNQPEHEESK